MSIIPVRDEAHWHELRAKHVGGSDVAALFGLSSFSTRWQLWMEKSGKLPSEDLSKNRAVMAGKFFESGIAEWAAHLWGWKIKKVEEYHTADDTPGMGATLDYATLDGVPLEIKWNSGFGGEWVCEGDTIIEAPEKYILQVQHQLACYNTNAPYAWLVVLIKNEPRRMKIPRHEGIISDIKAEVTGFWQSIEDGIEPDPDFNLDAKAIDRLLEQAPLTDVELEAEHAILYTKYLDAAATERLAKEAKESARAQLLLLAKERMEGANTKLERAVVRCGDHKMSISTVAPNFGTTITEDMVGAVIGTRKGYQRISIS